MGGTLGVKLWKSFLVGGEMCLAHAVAENQRLPSQDLAGTKGRWEVKSERTAQM
jgi:hypothetical protein